MAKSKKKVEPADTMDFKSAAQKQCYLKIVPWMKEIFGEFLNFRDDLPLIGVTIGSTFVQVTVHPWGETDSTICTRCYVVTKVELNPDLTMYLLRKNDELRFGAFGVDSENDIFFEHTIVGSSCDKNELKASVMAVVSTSDQYDDEIVSRWGGLRAVDRG